VGRACHGVGAKMRRIAKGDYNKLLQALEEANSDEYTPLGSAAGSVLAIADFLDAISVPIRLQSSLILAFVALLDFQAQLDYEHKVGPKPKSVLAILRSSGAAAAVTALKSCGWELGDALKRISKETKIDVKTLKSLRYNISCGRTDQITAQLYQRFVNDFGARLSHTSEEETLNEVRSFMRSCLLG
jgi:hypothetical protein